jgi:hypothetical protein
MVEMISWDREASVLPSSSLSSSVLRPRAAAPALPPDSEEGGGVFRREREAEAEGGGEGCRHVLTRVASRVMRRWKSSTAADWKLAMTLSSSDNCITRLFAGRERRAEQEGEGEEERGAGKSSAMAMKR